MVLFFPGYFLFGAIVFGPINFCLEYFDTILEYPVDNAYNTSDLSRIQMFYVNFIASDDIRQVSNLVTRLLHVCPKVFKIFTESNTDLLL